MYPNLYYFFRDLLGVEWQWARFINSFGVFVALAFVSAAYVLTRELQRKEKAGLLGFKEEKIVVGKAATAGELLTNVLLGFLMGYKIIGAFLLAGEGINTQEFIFSSQGSWPAGIVLALVFGWLKWHEKNKQKMNKPETRIIRIWAHERVGDMTILAALFGFAGAKVFHNLENWDEFSADPLGALLSFSGLTFYGGLICAALAIIVYARRKNIGIRHLADAMGPALILAYAIGRIGCQVSGDGDWGILNSAYVADKDGVVRLAEEGEFNRSLRENFAYYRTGEFRAVNTNDVPHAAFKGTSFLPDWLFAYTYPHNVNSMGVRLAECSDPEHCQYLPLPVFPTPLYETIMGLFIFGVLMFLRNRIKVAGVLFSLYLIFNGVERFLIEKIRVNTKYDFGSFQPTQAELISSVLVLLGIGLWIVCYRMQHRKAH